MQGWTALLIVCAISLAGSGCVHSRMVRLDNVQRLERDHTEGMLDALLASPKAEAFVKEALRTINDLEYELERR